MFIETVDQFAKTAVAKAAFLRRSPLGFTISSMMAGAYVGLGIILIFCVGNAVDPSIRPIVMGASFGIALTLVIIVCPVNRSEPPKMTRVSAMPNEAPITIGRIDGSTALPTQKMRMMPRPT